MLAVTAIMAITDLEKTKAAIDRNAFAGRFVSYFDMIGRSQQVEVDQCMCRKYHTCSCDRSYLIDRPVVV